MQDQDIKLTERMYLRAYLHIDDTDALHEFDAQGIEIRDAVVKVLTESGVGSWTLRKSSIKDSSLINVKILSYLNAGAQAAHIVLCHVIGLGYYSTNSVKREQQMPGVQDGETHASIPAFTTIFPCIIDLLEDIRKSYPIQFDKYCKK
jgi:hypothetical protein